jgi:hypothetical protein
LEGGNTLKALFLRNKKKGLTMAVEDVIFLGRKIKVTPEMGAALNTAQDSLQGVFDSLSADEKLAFFSSQPTDSVDEWCGIIEEYGGHADHKAIDINLSTDPYIATRTGEILGGEGGPGQLLEVRQRAVEVCDRATQFFRGADTFADIGARGPGESTESVYARFRSASENLVSYLSFSFNSTLTFITREPAADIEALSEEDLELQLSRELKAKDVAIADLQAFMQSPEFQNVNPHYPLDAVAQYGRILRDYEHVRIPMVAGAPSAVPGRTRNPLKGFLNFRVDLAVAFCDVSMMRWGACDFGPDRNGDIMHFDIRMPRPT